MGICRGETPVAADLPWRFPILPRAVPDPAAGPPPAPPRGGVRRRFRAGAAHHLVQLVQLVRRVAREAWAVIAAAPGAGPRGEGPEDLDTPARAGGAAAGFGAER